MEVEYTVAPLPKIRLNVGGKLFSAANTFLTALQIDLTTLFVIRSTRSSRVTYFLDRDPYYFRKVIALIKECDGVVTSEQLHGLSYAMLVEMYRYGLIQLSSLPGSEDLLQIHLDPTATKTPRNLIKIYAPDSSFTVHDGTLASSSRLTHAIRPDQTIQLEKSSGVVRVLINLLRIGLARSKDRALLHAYGIAYWDQQILHHPSVVVAPSTDRLVQDHHLSQIQTRANKIGPKQSIVLWKELTGSKEEYLEPDPSDPNPSSRYVTTIRLPGSQSKDRFKSISQIMVAFPIGKVADLEQILLFSKGSERPIATWRSPYQSHLRKVTQLLQERVEPGLVRGQLALLPTFANQRSVIPNDHELSIQFYATQSVIQPQLAIQESWSVSRESGGVWMTDHQEQSWSTPDHFRTTVSHSLTNYQGIRDLVCYLTVNDRILTSSLQELWVGKPGCAFGDLDHLIALTGTRVSLLDEQYYHYCFAPRKQSLAGLLNGTGLQFHATWQTDYQMIDPFPSHAKITSHLIVTHWIAS